jgi:hypothetical protein
MPESVGDNKAMTIVKEVIEAIDVVATAIDNTRKIVSALNDASDYLRKSYPDSVKHLEGLFEEIRTTLVGLAQVSDVVTEFRFSTAGADLDRQPARFNDFVISRKERIAAMKNSIETLKGSSAETARQADAIAAWGGRRYWQLFDFLGRGAALEAQLAIQFNDLWAVDGRIVEMFTKLVNAAQTALDETSEALGPSGTADPSNVPKAAAILGEYAREFKKVEAQCIELAAKITSDIRQLSLA